MKRAQVIEVRPTRPDDGEFFAPCTWIATCSRGYRFGGTSEVEARELAEQYHNPTHARSERGRVSHPEPQR